MPLRRQDLPLSSETRFFPIALRQGATQTDETHSRIKDFAFACKLDNIHVRAYRRRRVCIYMQEYSQNAGARTRACAPGARASAGASRDTPKPVALPREGLRPALGLRSAGTKGFRIEEIGRMSFHWIFNCQSVRAPAGKTSRGCRKREERRREAGVSSETPQWWGDWVMG